MISPFAPWYRRGTVTVTQGSAVITGVDTAWLLGPEIRTGDVFTLNGTKVYEIATVDSATQITLVTPYAEASAAAVNYAVIRNFAVVPATELINRTLDTVYIWKNFQDQMYDWQTKPYNNATPATVRFTALDGTYVEVKTLQQCIGEMNIQSYRGFIELYKFSPIGSSQVINFNFKAYQQVVVDKNATLTFNDPEQTARCILQLVRPNTGSFTITFPNNVRDRDGKVLSTFTLNDTTPAQVFEFLWDGVTYYRING